MDPAVTDPLAREARMLAAIVFTDVVGFSKLASQNEARVYTALQRDMGVMTNLCRAHGGQVLNTMGDGMLLCFSSAVDAMSCAVEIQRTLHSQSHTLPAVEILHHRIGVHLGDVIMNGDNVFGDGVNVAARLQALAQPDAVCFSHTVYEVVKNKLKFDAKYLGPRQLKNLVEPVKVWQVPPIGDARAMTDRPIDLVLPAAEIETAGGARGVKAGVLVLASLALVGLLVFIFTRMKAPPPLVTGGKAHSRLGLRDLKNPAVKPTPGDATADSTTDGTTPAMGSPTMSLQAMKQQIAAWRAGYNFPEIVNLLTANGAADPDDYAKLETYRQLAALKTFVDAQIAAATPMNPVQVDHLDLPGGAAPAKIYPDPAGGAPTIQTDNGNVPWNPDPKQYMEIASAALAHPLDNSTASPDIEADLKLFSKEFGVPVSP